MTGANCDSKKFDYFERRKPASAANSFKNLDNFGRKSNSSSIYNLNNEEHKSHRVQKIKHEKIVELKKARSTKINSIATKISDLDSKTPSNLFNANKISTKDSLKTSVEKYDEALTKIILNSNAIKDMYPKKTELLNSMKTSFKFSDFKANLTKISMMFKLTKPEIIDIINEIQGKKYDYSQQIDLFEQIAKVSKIRYQDCRSENECFEFVKLVFDTFQTTNSWTNFLRLHFMFNFEKFNKEICKSVDFCIRNIFTEPGHETFLTLYVKIKSIEYFVHIIKTHKLKKGNVLAAFDKIFEKVYESIEEKFSKVKDCSFDSGLDFLLLKPTKHVTKLHTDQGHFILHHMLKHLEMYFEKYNAKSLLQKMSDLSKTMAESSCSVSQEIEQLYLKNYYRENDVEEKEESSDKDKPKKKKLRIKTEKQKQKDLVRGQRRLNKKRALWKHNALLQKQQDDKEIQKRDNKLLEECN